MTSGAMPSARAAANTANLAVKPLVSGIPARASMRNVTAAATTGARFPRPAQADRCVASPSGPRTSDTSPNSATVVKP